MVLFFCERRSTSNCGCGKIVHLFKRKLRINHVGFFEVTSPNRVLFHAGKPGVTSYSEHTIQSSCLQIKSYVPNIYMNYSCKLFQNTSQKRNLCLISPFGDSTEYNFFGMFVAFLGHLGLMSEEYF